MPNPNRRCWNETKKTSIHNFRATEDLKYGDFVIESPLGSYEVRKFVDGKDQGCTGVVIQNCASVGDRVDVRILNLDRADCGDSTGVVGGGSLYEVYETTVTPISEVEASPNIIPFDAEENPNTDFSLSGGQVTMAFDGRIKVSYSVSTDGLDSDRSTTVVNAYLNGSELARTRSYAYNRTVANGEGTANKTFLLTVADGDILDIRTFVFGDNVQTIADASNLVVERIA